MLRHVVMWTLNDPVDAAAFATALRSCADLVPGIREFDVGVRTDGYEGDCDVVLVSTFDDEDALTAYLEHPHHRQVAPGLGAMRKARVALDYPIEPPAPASRTSTSASTAAPPSEPTQGDWE